MSSPAEYLPPAYISQNTSSQLCAAPWGYRHRDAPAKILHLDAAVRKAGEPGLSRRSLRGPRRWSWKGFSKIEWAQPSTPSEPKITAGRLRTRSAPFRLEILSLPYSCFLANLVLPPVGFGGFFPPFSPLSAPGQALVRRGFSHVLECIPYYLTTPRRKMSRRAGFSRGRSAGPFAGPRVVFFRTFGPAFSVLVWAFLTDWYQPGAPAEPLPQRKKGLPHCDLQCGRSFCFVMIQRPIRPAGSQSGPRWHTARR